MQRARRVILVLSDRNAQLVALRAVDLEPESAAAVSQSARPLRLALARHDRHHSAFQMASS